MANAETIDSLLVSLGLDVDQKSFQKATDAINDVKNKSLQLLAAAGVGVGFDHWTRGVAKMVGGLNDAAFAARTTVKEVEAMRHAFDALGRSEAEADAAMRQMANVQRNIQMGIIPETEFSSIIAGLGTVDSMKALSKFLNETRDEQRKIRALTELGIAPGSTLHKDLLDGRIWDKFAEAQGLVTGVSPELNDSVDEFNDQMAKLKTNFNELSKAMGEELLPPLNAFLSISNEFIRTHPEVIKAGVTIAGILGTLSAFKGLAWIFGLSGAGRTAGAGTAAAGKVFLRKAGIFGLATAATYDLFDEIGEKFANYPTGQDESGRRYVEEVRKWPSWMDWLHGGSGKVLRERRYLDSEETDIPQLAQFSNAGRKKAPEHLMPEFTKASQKHGVPVDVLLGMAKQESGFNPSAIGPQTKWGRAQGIMQYLSGTAASLGIDPLDPSQAIDAAAKQIRERLDMGESIEEAIAHHHAGPNRALWGTKTADYVQKVTGHAAGFRGMEDALDFSQGAFSGPSDSLPGSSYSPATQTFTQTNNVTIESSGNPDQDQQMVRRYTRNAADSMRSDVY